MKILIFMTQFYQLGGAERLAVELAAELNNRGVRADILCMSKEDLPGVAEAKADLLNKGIPAIHFLNMNIHPSIITTISAITYLRKLIRREKYDIVETSLLSPCVLASWAIVGGRVRHVVGLHEVFEKERHNTWRYRILRFSIKCNRNIKFYTISKYALKHWLEYSGTPEHCTRLVYNAISDNCFTSIADRNNLHQEFGLPRSARIILFVGRLLVLKGIDTIYEALGPILSEQNLCILYIGAEMSSVTTSHVDKGLVAQLKDQVRRDELMDRVLFLGWRYDVTRLMASSDILVHPARNDGFGLVLAEAMAVGLPVVASNVEGIPEVLEGSDLIMVPPNDPKALRDAVLQTLHRTPEEMSTAIRKGRECAERFRMNNRVENMIDLF